MPEASEITITQLNTARDVARQSVWAAFNVQLGFSIALTELRQEDDEEKFNHRIADIHKAAEATFKRYDEAITQAHLDVIVTASPKPQPVLVAGSAFSSAHAASRRPLMLCILAITSIYFEELDPVEYANAVIKELPRVEVESLIAEIELEHARAVKSVEVGPPESEFQPASHYLSFCISADALRKARDDGRLKISVKRGGRWYYSDNEVRKIFSYKDWTKPEI